MASLIKLPRRWEDETYNSASIQGREWLEGTHWNSEWTSDPLKRTALSESAYRPADRGVRHIGSDVNGWGWC